MYVSSERRMFLTERRLASASFFFPVAADVRACSPSPGARSSRLVSALLTSLLCPAPDVGPASRRSGVGPTH